MARMTNLSGTNLDGASRFAQRANALQGWSAQIRRTLSRYLPEVWAPVALCDLPPPFIIRAPPERWQSGRMYLTRNQASV